MTEKRVLTIPQIAKMLGLTRERVGQMDREGKLPFQPVPGFKQHRYYAEDVMLWVKMWKKEKARLAKMRAHQARLVKPRRGRPALKGDFKDPAPVDHLTFVNHFSKWYRHLRLGWIPLPPVETLRIHLEPMIENLREVCEYQDPEWASIRPDKMSQKALTPDKYQKEIRPWKLGCAPRQERE
jgi:hypothetical protein